MIFLAGDCMLTPEESIRIQNAIGADIIMQLDDVVESTLTGPRVEESTYRLFTNSLSIDITISTIFIFIYLILV